MSRPRSTRGASAAPARGASAGARGVYVPTARNDIFTALLGVALVAMITGCVLLVIVWKRYDFKTKASAVTPTPSSRTALAVYPEKMWSVRL